MQCSLGVGLIPIGYQRGMFDWSTKSILFFATPIIYRIAGLEKKFISELSQSCRSGRHQIWNELYVERSRPALPRVSNVVLAILRSFTFYEVLPLKSVGYVGQTFH